MDERRLFFALWPDHRQRETLRDLLTPVLSSVEGNKVDRRNWHVTLVFIGEFPARRIPELQEAVSDIRCPTLRLRFDRVSFWARPKVAALQTATVPVEMSSLVTQIEMAAEPFGFRPQNRTYRPHITLARKVRAFHPEPLARPTELVWSGFELMESVPTARGVHYSPLKQQAS